MVDVKELTTLEDWGLTLEGSSQRRVVVFKHSTICPISAKAWNEYEAFLNEVVKGNIQFTMVKVIESRAVSNQIAEDLGVKHESPQIILIEDQKAIGHTSHGQITRHRLDEMCHS